MKYRTFKQNKLWRDKAIELLESQGSYLTCRQLDDTEFDKELRAKLIEEAYEVCAAQSREELLAELADVQEVIQSLMKLHVISAEELAIIQIQKREKRGGFDGRYYVEVAHHPVGSFGESYCLAAPEKYPEITE